MIDLALKLTNWIGDKVEHLVALVLIRDNDWHLLLCSCGAFNELPE